MKNFYLWRFARYAGTSAQNRADCACSRPGLDRGRNRNRERNSGPAGPRCGIARAAVYPVYMRGRQAAGIFGRLRGWAFFKSVNRLDPAAQEQLLTAIDRQSHDGGQIRFISSSSQPLDQLVGEGRFPAALYHHLAGARVRVAALRERFGDVPELFGGFVEQHASAAGLPAPVPSSELLILLESYSWPGNGRELSNSRHFSQLRKQYGNDGRVEMPCRSHTARLAGETAVTRTGTAGIPGIGVGIILRTLQTHRWNRRRAAKTLNISYRSLLYKMKACKLRGENAAPGI